MQLTQDIYPVRCAGLEFETFSFPTLYIYSTLWVGKCLTYIGTEGSVMITSNLPFSKWESIFKDPMTPPAAIDRLVHHSVIHELNVPSYRMEQARQRKQ